MDAPNFSKALTRKARDKVNDALYALGTEYHDGLPIDRIDAILTENGFEQLLEGIYTGHDGKHSEGVGNNCWLRKDRHIASGTSICTHAQRGSSRRTSDL